MTSADPRDGQTGSLGEPVAAIDCGTNSIRLLIARRDERTGRLVDLERHLEMVRLGYGVDRTGRFDPDAVERTLAAARGYAELIARHGARRIRFAATSATRDAENRQEFIRGIEDILGVTPEVITGAEEAELSFRGAVTTIDDLPPGPRLVADIGGGSTELVLGTERPTHRLSMDMGSVRLTERHLGEDPPAPEQIAAAARDIDAHLDDAFAEIPIETAASLVGVAGTVTTVTAVAQGLTIYEPDSVHGAAHTVPEAIGWCDRLVAMTRAQRTALQVIHPGRVDVIGAGALIWSRILDRVSIASGIGTARTSEHDILDGLALSAAEMR